MKKFFAAVLGVALIVSFGPGLGIAQSSCPAEVDQAKEMLSTKVAAVKPEDVQAPRGNREGQAPRGNQDVQAPRAAAGATTQTQVPRSNFTKAASLVKEAEAACKAGNVPLASKKAKGAMALLK
jgi:hypothetical protein